MGYFPLASIPPLDFPTVLLFQEQHVTASLHLGNYLSLIVPKELPSITTALPDLLLYEPTLRLLSLVLLLQQWIVVVDFLGWFLQQEQLSTVVKSRLRYPGLLIELATELHLLKHQHKTLLLLLFFRTFLLSDQTCHLYFTAHLHFK